MSYVYTDKFAWKIIRGKINKKLKKVFFCCYPAAKATDNYMTANLTNGSAEKKRRTTKKKENKGNIYQYFHASLTIEIIYTVLNAITQQIKNKEKNEIKKESKHILAQIMNSEKVRREVSDVYK